MATDINRVAISGNLTRDPEVRSTASGMTVMSFGVAANGSVKNNQTGEWEDRANFVDCTMFGKRAESVGQYLSKGMKVFIDGSLRWSQWEKDGNKRSKLEVIVDDIVFTGNYQEARQVGYQQLQHGGQYGQPQPYQQPQQYVPTHQYAPPQQAQPYQQPVQCAPQQPQPPHPAQQQMPMVDQSASYYGEDIPF